MTEEGAAYAVLGADIEALGAAVARHWGLDEGVLTMIRRQPLAVPVRAVEHDDDMLRTVASCANETIDALGLGATRVAGALNRVVQRYGRVLDIGLRDLQAALQDKSAQAIAQTTHAPLDELGAQSGRESEALR